MKKLILLALLGSLLGACKKTSYTITGSLPIFKEGKTVYLSTTPHFFGKFIDSCVVKNGLFYFEGKQDSTIRVYLTTVQPDGLEGLHIGDFFLENGDIIIKENFIEDESLFMSITGSPHNDIEQKMRDEMAMLTFKRLKLEEWRSDTTRTEKELQQTREEMIRIYKEFKKIEQRYFEANWDNELGRYLFKKGIYKYDSKKLKEWIDRLLTKWPNDRNISIAQKEVINEIRTMVGEKFIDYTMQTPDGQAIKLSDFINKNKYTLVSIWDSRDNTYPTYVIPHLKRAYQTYKKQGLEIVGISLDKDSTTWTTTIEKWDMPWPQMSDLKGRQSQACELYNINLIPYQMLIDQNGIILARNIKPDKLNEDLGKILK